ncbi:MAG: FHA domain-containing protein [Chthonomonadales bacterium]
MKRNIWAISGVLACFAAASIAQTPAPKSSGRSIVISTPDALGAGGEFLVRPLPSADAKGQPPLPLGPFKDKKFTVSIDPETLGKAPKLAIDDSKRGNTAIVDLPKSDTLDLHSTDFDHVHRVDVKVTYESKPVAVAQVRLQSQDGKVDVSKTIDPTAKGTVAFDDVPVGKNKLTVTYGDKLSQSQDLPVSTDHIGPTISVNVPVSNKVNTLDVPDATPVNPGTPAVPAQTGATAAPPVREPDHGSGIAGLLGSVIGIGVVGAGIYFFYKWAQSGGLAASLKKAGIEVSGPVPPQDPAAPWNPNAQAAPVVMDPTVCQFCGQKKDANGNCACSVGAGGAPNAFASTPVVSNIPRLVATAGVHSGKVIPVDPSGPPVTFGREVGNTVVLDNDTTVSRHHATLRSEGGSFIVKDEGSSNGVYVNGVRISGQQTVRPGDDVQIGNTRFRLDL